VLSPRCATQHSACLGLSRARLFERTPRCFRLIFDLLDARPLIDSNEAGTGRSWNHRTCAAGQSRRAV
jgi:hypothetical protein